MASSNPPPAPPAGPTKPREWTPRVWQGCDYFAWLRLLARNRAAVEPPYWYIAGIASCLTFGNTVLRWLQEGMYGDRIDETRVQPPIFVIGHWRTGTTLLHELLSLDDRFTSPTTLQCVAPCSFLLSEDFYKKYLGFAVPEKRPMDNMAAGWDRPQEDEFALALLGQPSPYTDFAFPNHPPLDPGSLDLSGLTPRQLAAWKRTLLRFLKAVQFRSPGKRLVLKSPPHTARVPVLLEMFPDAKFVHIVRDPYVVYPSTVNLWTSFGKKQGFQTPRIP
ncbi:MAG: sulfotransferase family protein, partial [Fimbriiglobus sp.]